MTSHFIPTPTGRQLGSKNKVKMFTHESMQAKFDELGFDPLTEAIALYRHVDTQPRERALIIKDLLQYVYPKRRTVEVSGDTTHTSLNITWNNTAQDTLTADDVKYIIDGDEP
jgi:hypothetical protein